jgi:hypothetical protein
MGAVSRLGLYGFTIHAIFCMKHIP